MPRHALVLLVLLSSLPVFAEEAPTRIALPHAAVSFDRLPGWTVTQFDGSVFDLRKDGARLWAYTSQRGEDASRRVRRYVQRMRGDVAKIETWEIRGMRDAGRFWYVSNGEHRMLGSITRDDDSGLDVEVIVPDGKPGLARRGTQDPGRLRCQPISAPPPGRELAAQLDGRPRCVVVREGGGEGG